MAEKKKPKWIKIGQRWVKNGSTPWTDGHYTCKVQPTLTLLVEGENIIMDTPNIKEGDELAKGCWKYGDFGEADSAVTEATGEKFNNWYMDCFGGMLKMKGVLSEDGKKITFINMLKEVDTYQWVTEDEFAAFMDSGDPADAPPSHYTPQPENLGKFLFISGAPGLGKSTTGLLLSKMAGYVYYEADCFSGGTNPYLPPDAKEPSMDAIKQRPLKGISQDRANAVKGGLNDFLALLDGKEYNIETLKTFYGEMCKDLTKERKRLGGDWVVAQAVPLRSLRDHMRAELGPDLVFVVLNMKKEDQKKRITARHGESDGDNEFFNAMLEKAYDLYKPATADEPNAIDIEVTADMTREDVVEQILKKIQKEERNGETPWADGHYLCKEQATYTLLVEGENITMEGSSVKEGDPMAKGTWKFGNFGEADPAVAEATGKKFNNWHMDAWGGMFTMKGVVSDDGKKVTFISMLKEVDEYQWVTEEEYTEFWDSGDPAEAPPSHYKTQPENLGKFLFISGAPGLGKSTTGLLLSQKAGYVYYEADCFLGGTNPYLPPDAKEPSMEAIKQKPLKGIPQDRLDAVSGGINDFMSMIGGKEYSTDNVKTFYTALCKDLASERKRLGGDWAIAQAVPLRSLRDVIRAELGPDLVFVVLNMKKEDQQKRIRARHGQAVDDGTFDLAGLCEKAYDFYEPATADEPNAIDIEVTADMTREDVVEKILKAIQEKQNIVDTPWADGHYLCKGMASFGLRVEGESSTMVGPNVKEGDAMNEGSWKLGDFGEADPAVAEATGKKLNNWHMEAWGGMLKINGVLSEDGKTATFINLLKEVDTYQWVTEEEFAAYMDSGDPADAPSSHYTPQPENLGKFLFISGAPGLGKSTTGLLLSQKAGYVYYEADCFGTGNNPYLPPDSKEPSMDTVKQKPLKGIPQERLDAVLAGVDQFMAMLTGKEYIEEPIKGFFEALCKDLNNERKRLGGDWVVAMAVPFRSHRDLIRAALGPDLVFVVLNMNKEDQQKRLIARHGEDGSLDMNKFIENVWNVYEPAAVDEPNTIDLEVTADMTREDVVDKIMKAVQEKED